MELVPRNEIYVGELLYLPSLDINEAVFCRGMIFKITKDNFAEDLIYTTPTKYSLNANNEMFTINDYANINSLLKYLNFDVMLSSSDLRIIYKKLITHNWWIRHNNKNEQISKDILDVLSLIGENNKGTPFKEEPDYAFIKRKQ